MTCTDEHDIDRDHSTTYFIAGLESDNLWLRTRTSFLERQLEEVNASFFRQRAELQLLQERRNNTASSSSSTTPPLPRPHSSDPNPHLADIWISINGRRYHRQNCVYAQGGMRYSACHFCHRNT